MKHERSVTWAGKAALSLLCALAAAALLIPGCGKKDTAGGLEPAIVEQADFVGRVDYRSLKGAPVSEFLEDQEQRGNSGDRGQDLLEKLQGATGLDEGDIVGILVSGNLEGADLAGEISRESAAAIDASLGVSLAKPLDEDRFEAGLRLLVGESGRADLTVMQAEGRSIYGIVPDSPEEPLLYTALSGDGRAFYVAFREKSLHATLKRQGKGERLTRDLRQAEGVLPEGSQLTYALVVPPAMRAQTEAKIAELENGAAENAGAGLVYGLIRPFRNLTAISVGMRLSEKIDVSLFADLGSEADALQATALIQTMAVPFLTAQLARTGGGTMTEYTDRLTVGNDGRTLRLALSLSESDLAALQPAAR